jgi:Tfp pilus assembly protein PilO
MTLRKRDRIVLAALAVVALLGAFYMLALKPERQQASTLQSQIVTQRQAVDTARQSYITGRAAQAALKTDGKQWAALKLAVPEQSDIPGLLRTLEKTSDSSHVGMQALSLSAGSGSSSDAAATASPTTAASGATPVPITLTFTGGYVALNNLVRKLTGLVSMAGGSVHASGPLLSINSVSLSGSGKLTGNLTATIYQLATPAGATTGGQG